MVTKNEILDFIEILPDWRNLIDGIECIHLSGYSETSDASYRHYRRDKTGTIELSAWNSDLTQEISTDYFNAHRIIFEKIELKFEIRKDGVFCWFDEAKAKAFLLIHIFLHELGHHLDRMRKSRSTSGEPFAENFANRLEDEIWLKYVEKFGKP